MNATDIWFRRFLWSRNNTIDLLNSLKKEDLILKISGEKFQSIGFQFACIATTTDTYIRKLSSHKDQSFGKLYFNKKVYSKTDIQNSGDLLKEVLNFQISLLKNISEKIKEDEDLDILFRISDHEYLHQGQF